jgi:3-hydroxyisobutyrate dehydrogenase-like beta-hydroxyacid dehydrogenase
MSHRVAVVAMGEMGSAIAGVLHNGGASVVTSLSGRSRRSAALAREAGVVDAGSLESAIRQADIFLSIVPPDKARQLAEDVASVLRQTAGSLLYLECNAISPHNVSQIGDLLAQSGGRCVDAGIIGFPPGRGSPSPHVWMSGAHAEEARVLAEYGLDVRLAGSQLGQASGLKMCYAAFTKGLMAIATESFTTASTMGLTELLISEMRMSQPELLLWIDKALPSSPPKAYRWVDEMLQIGATFQSVGLTPDVFNGAADVYRSVARTVPGREMPEHRKPRSLEQLGTELAAELAKANPDPS